MPDLVAPTVVEWGAAARTRPDRRSGGDLAIVTGVPQGALVAAVDGVGAGAEAARAARAACAVVRTFAGDDLIRLVLACHENLRNTRGAVMSVALLSGADSTLTWLGVGNVEGRLFSADPAAPRPKASLPVLSGLLGHRVRRVRTATATLRRGDVLVLATDGIAAAFGDALELSGRPQEIAERIVAAHWNRVDDALALVVRYLGASR